MSRRNFVVHIPLYSDDRGYCGRYPSVRPEPDKGWVERPCRACVSAQERAETRSRASVELEADIASLRAALSDVRKALAKKLAGLSVDQIRRYEEKIRASLGRVKDAERELRRLEPRVTR